MGEPKQATLCEVKYVRFNGCEEDVREDDGEWEM
jgi:hypothetical protein